MTTERGAAPSIMALAGLLTRMPGIGAKTAKRLAFHLVRDDTGHADDLAEAITGVVDNSSFCQRCHNLTDAPLCNVCTDPNRDPSAICAVEEPFDLLALEQAGGYRGLYHVLHGALSPMNGVRPEDIRIPDLLRRLREPQVTELLLATNSTLEGEATNLYIAARCARPGLHVTRLARGLPTGSSLQHTDALTLARALGARSSMDSPGSTTTP